MSFSSGLQLASLDDYIAPSQTCVIQPAESRLGSRVPEPPAAGQGLVLEMEGNESLGPVLVADTEPETAPGLEPAKITLADCLACSGCVTSAEAVLVAAQSSDQLLALLADASPDTRVALSVSSQALAALAAAAGLPSSAAALEATAGFAVDHLRASWVNDTELAREVSVRAVADVFLARRRAVHQDDEPGPRALPALISSSCPGWICYAETTHPDMLPNIAPVRSPLALQGALVTQFLDSAQAPVLHVAVMQCFDKKLEATRDAFKGPDGEPQTHLVLSVAEFLDLVAAKVDGGLAAVPRATLTPDLAPLVDLDVYAQTGCLRGTSAFGDSDGYAEEVLRAVLVLQSENNDDVDDHNHNNGPVSWSKHRNKDFNVASAGGFTFATAYGFRNIQNVLREIESFDFVEVQACPSGCLNGGGMPKAPSSATRADRKAALDAVRALHRDVAPALNLPHPLVAAVEAWARPNAVTHTQFNAVAALDLDAVMSSDPSDPSAQAAHSAAQGDALLRAAVMW